MDNLASNQDLDLFERQAGRFSLIPLNGKRPFEQGWERWCETKRTFNRNDFEGHNAGVCCGPASGVLVLDVDDPLAFEALMVGNGLTVPKTFTVITGSGKPHYYFRYPQGGVVIRNRSFKHPVYPRHTIYDIRGLGGQVVAAGSVHPETGKLYRLEKKIAFAQPPDWLLSCNNDGVMNVDAVLEIRLPQPKDQEFVHSLRVSQDSRELILEGAPKGQRSEAGMSVINALLGGGYDDKTVFFIFNHFAIGAKYREVGATKVEWLGAEIRRSRQYLGRQQNMSRPATMEQPAQVTLEDAIKELNEKHAVVMVGGKCLVINEVSKPGIKQPEITYSTTADFRGFYANKEVIQPQRGLVNLAQAWLRSPNRREYKGIVFSPDKEVEGYYNLYSGFAIEPKPGEWTLFKAHIREVLARGDEDIYNYIMAWMAHLLQQPGGERPGTSIVLRGKQGTGKGCFAKHLGKILGKHFLHITSQDQITGKFNNHLKDALLVFCDEGFWAGTKSAEGRLKAMITEEEFMIEPKGKDAFAVNNYIRLIVASNNSWVVPAGLEERRFFVLDISDKYMQDVNYFKPLNEQMDNGGREGMLHDLLQYDFSGVDLRKFPRTDALMDQIVTSMSPEQKFWYERLSQGTLCEHHEEWRTFIPKAALYNDYIEFSKKLGVRFPILPSEFGKKINELCPQVEDGKRKVDDPTYDLGNGRKSHYVFPALDECRKAFAQLVNMEPEWS